MTQLFESVHEEKKLFICEICDKGFSKKQNMKRHVSSLHLNVKYVTTILIKRRPELASCPIVHEEKKQFEHRIVP